MRGMPTPARGYDVWMSSVHDRAAARDGSRYLRFDVAELLDALGPSAREYRWIIRPTLDCTGPGAEELCDRVERAAERGEWVILPGDEMARAAQGFVQTLEGAFIAIPQELTDSAGIAGAADLSRFPESAAQIAIEAVDGSFFTVYAKQGEHVEALRRRFRDVRTESAERFFSLPISARP